MENAGIENSSWTFIFIGISVIVITQLYFYMRKLSCKENGKKNTAVKNEAPLDKVKEKHSSTTQSSGPATHNKQHKQPKKQTSNNWKNKGSYTHPFLVTNLMGHTKKITDLDCTSDGKYLVSCAEDDQPPDPGESSSRSSSEGSRTPPGGSSPGSPKGERRIPRQPRRRRKPRPTRDVGSPPQPAVSAITFHHTSSSPRNSIVEPGPLPRYSELNMTDSQLAECLSRYLLNEQQLATLGYPVESPTHPHKAVIFSADFRRIRGGFDVNAREFVPGIKMNSSYWTRDDDSGRGSGTSSPRSGDSDPDSEEERMRNSVERRCSRCQRGFYISSAGEYLTRERCRHHWGRLQRINNPSESPMSIWSCCGNISTALGCVKASLHVWSGKTSGMNGPLEGYVRTKYKPAGLPRHQILALDSEMCYTVAGLQVAKIEVVGSDGRRVYGAYVMPEDAVIDYNTRFSGICERDMKKATKTLKDVQRDLLKLIDSQTILVGHGLENDLRALRILHDNIVDTAVCFPHARGLPFRQSLRSLAAQHLERNVQEDQHCPLEDARASLDLMLWKIQNEPFPQHTREYTSKFSHSYREFLIYLQRSITVAD